VVQVVIAAAIAVGVLSGYDVRTGGFTPQVSNAVAQHASTAEAMSVGTGQSFDDLVVGTVTPSTAPPRSTSQLTRPYVAPATLAGYALTAGFMTSRGVQLVYEDGGHTLSLFEQPGTLDFDDLPSPGHRFTVAGKDAWRWDRRGVDGRVLVVQSDDVVVTVVGDIADDVMRAARALPSKPDPGLLDRIEQASSDAIGQLGAAP
jgi:hypothetical protein